MDAAKGKLVPKRKLSYVTSNLVSIAPWLGGIAHSATLPHLLQDAWLAIQSAVLALAGEHLLDLRMAVVHLSEGSSRALAHRLMSGSCAERHSCSSSPSLTTRLLRLVFGSTVSQQRRE